MTWVRAVESSPARARRARQEASAWGAHETLARLGYLPETRTRQVLAVKSDFSRARPDADAGWTVFVGPGASVRLRTEPGRHRRYSCCWCAGVLTLGQ